MVSFTPGLAETITHNAPDARAALASRYIASGIQPQQMVGTVIREMAKNPMFDIDQSDVVSIESSIDFAQLKRQLVNAAMKTYSADDLTALANFYDSPAGRSITRKTPAFMSEMMPTVQAMTMQAVMSYMAQKQIRNMGQQPARDATPARDYPRQTR